ncbi:MAG TPA: family 10 glycosylhydrolase [Blastocatellia bacterium]|nr:family 10 glycosylhydrolase [Blastocatellia bacterium]
MTFPSALGAAQQRPAAEKADSLREVRALWVVRTSLVSPEQIRQMVARAVAGGFNTLIVQVRGRGDAYYQSRWEPRADALQQQPTTFDPLALVVQEAHRAGLTVHAWLNTSLVANMDELPQSRQHPIYEHPEWLMVPRALAAKLYHLDARNPQYLAEIVAYSKGDRSQLEGLYLSPAHPAVKEHLYSLWMDVLERYEVDGLHFDYVRYPNTGFDYSRTALERFRALVEQSIGEGERKVLAAVAERDPLTYAAAFPERYAQFQRDQVTELVERIRFGVKKRRPAAIISAAVFANDEDAYYSRFQDWKLWLRRGLLDVVCPMAYTPDTETFRKQISVAVGHAAGHQVWAGIGAYRIPPESAIEKIQAARELGAHGFVLFSYDAMVKPSAHSPAGDYLERIRQAVTASSAGETRQ